jgi:hypothetical protein
LSGWLSGDSTRATTATVKNRGRQPVSPLTLFGTDHVLSYGLPFAAAFLFIRVLNLAAPLKAAPIVAWALFLCSLALHMDRGSEVAFALQIANLTPYMQLPLPVRQVAALGMAGAWLWVASGFVGALLRGRGALQLPSRADIAVALVAGIALPAAAAAPLLLPTMT